MLEEESEGTCVERAKRARRLMEAAKGYVELMLWHDAKKEFRKVSEEDLISYDDYADFAWLLFYTGQHKRAYEFSQRILERCPERYFAWMISSNALFRLKRFTEAKHFILNGPDDWKNRPNALHLLACIDVALRNFTSARMNLLRAIELNPDLVHDIHDDEDLRPLRELTGELRAATLRDKSFVATMAQTWRFTEENRVEEACARLESVGDSNQNNTLFLMRRSGVLMRDKQWQKALPLCVLLCRRMPHDIAPYLNAALCLKNLERLEEMGHFLMAAPEEKFEDKVYHDHAAVHYLKMGEIKRAKLSLQQVVRLNPSYAAKMRNDIHLKPLCGFLDWLLKCHAKSGLLLPAS